MKLYRENGCLRTRFVCAVVPADGWFCSLAGLWCSDLRRFKASPRLSLRALAPGTLQRAWRLQGQCASWVAIGAGMTPENTDRSRVLTIVITAPQQVHRIGARCLNHVIAGTGANFSSTCSKAIKRLQLGCRKPKLRARRNPLGSTCCGGVLNSVCEATGRLFHGGGRRLRRTTDAVGKSMIKHLTLVAA